MKSILCFGDSNTWGFIPGSGERYPYERRWTSVLAGELGSGYLVIPEGLNGRTTVFEDPVSGDKCGLGHLRMLLQTHKPIDLLLIMLGTNDLKDRFNLSAPEIAKAVVRLVEAAQHSGSGPSEGPPKILLVSPPAIVHAQASDNVFHHAVGKSHLLREAYAQAAAEAGVASADAGAFTVSSHVDGIHWSAEGHTLFGSGIAGVVRRLL